MHNYINRLATVSLKNGITQTQPLSTVYLQFLISLPITKVARLISVLSFKSKRINYLNLLWHVLIPSVEELPLILLRIRGIPGTLFSNFYLWLNSS